MGGYPCKSYAFSVTHEGAPLACRFMLWGAEKRIYICTVSAGDKRADAVETAVKSIIETFVPVSK